MGQRFTCSLMQVLLVLRTGYHIRRGSVSAVGQVLLRKGYSPPGTPVAYSLPSYILGLSIRVPVSIQKSVRRWLKVAGFELSCLVAADANPVVVVLSRIAFLNSRMGNLRNGIIGDGAKRAKSTGQMQASGARITCWGCAGPDPPGASDLQFFFLP